MSTINMRILSIGYAFVIGLLAVQCATGAETAAPSTNDRQVRQLQLFGDIVRVPPPPSLIHSAWAFNEGGNTCVTSKGHVGTCTTYRLCYPYFKIPDLTIWESWILGNYDTCSFFNGDGRQTFGVCCSNPIHSSAPTTMADDGETGETTTATQLQDKPDPPTQQSQKENNYPSWPPPIPTHPPDHAAPTHPPVSHPGSVDTVTPLPVSTTTWPTKPSSPVPTTEAHWQPTNATSTTTKPTDASGVYLTCGIKNGNPDQERIVGGHNADPNEWPWVVVIFSNGRQLCGGSLIDESHILTAAHCVAHMRPWDVAQMTVRLGDHNIKDNNEVQHVERRIKRLVRHRGFDMRTLYNDVAILTMDRPIEFSRTIRAICLPMLNSRLYSGTTGTVIGWGSLRENGPTPSVLQEVTIPIWSNTECRGKYGPAAPGGIVESMVCAGKATRDSCSGDSGGPLMVPEGSQWVQVGIVSWGIGCGKGQYPGVYTRVTHFMPWITKNIKDKRL